MKANKEINNIRRNFKSRSPEFLRDMYKMFIRPHLEYCITVWNPVYSGDSNALEKVQNRFTKLLRFGSTMTPSERNACLRITDHKSRRKRGDMIAVYKYFDSGSLFRHDNNDTTRSNGKKLRVIACNNNIRQHSFAIRSVNAWNCLPEHVVSAPTLNSFKARLDAHMFDQ